MPSRVLNKDLAIGLGVGFIGGILFILLRQAFDKILEQEYLMGAIPKKRKKRAQNETIRIRSIRSKGCK